MKKIMLLSLVFMTTFLRGQNVDPETFPALNSGIGSKYLYTNTGGEGKILVDSVATRARVYWRNGVNGQDSMGLGGSIVQPTTINVDGFQTIFSYGALSGMGFVPNLTLREQWLLITGSSDFRIATVNAFRDTTSGNESIGCAIDITDLSGSGKAKGFGNKYYPATNNHQSYWHYNNPSTSEQLYMGLDDFTGFTITPNGGGLVDPYLGTSIFLVKNTSGNNVFSISPTGEIKVLLNAYDDDTDAGANGLVQGDLYETSATNTLGLPRGIVMRKQ